MRALGVAVLCALAVSLPANAEDEATEQRTEFRTTGPVDVERLRASGQWDLDDGEWQRYETLMDGPRGLWSPDLDPVWVLGIHARSDSERRRYAEMAVERERERVADELAFQRAYDDAWDRLYPDRQLFADQNTGSIAGAKAPSDERTALPLEAMEDGDRLVLVADRQCRECTEVVNAVVQALADGAEWRVDVFLLDMDTDEEVREWATAQAIPLDLVRERRITLNRDDGTLAGYEPPALLRQDGLRWQRVSH
ncbi:TIGR03759 family integrating conjugative element protein [Aquisalimonas asiatica]|uniref:Integrating conjugative element protein, PFL_4693 family n=1 Tax=Aquisalimonas asiatica TaxID=406100 RepID=A0A1H8T269_9GAMM|nr:TIGR03759 family integrating conjugative element protein [Aquisalimonas asiatica]SEO85061.1 integrating conjugative element protein, PFL_4693 family [Aquisalimonas asiatica]